MPSKELHMIRLKLDELGTIEITHKINYSFLQNRNETESKKMSQKNSTSVVN